ncbi:MAG: 4-hydroxy-tetrahydrodipicolinate reductase [Ruminococcus sp.]|nr:4-hydroxy-tetrahydrodipicolinate reductase [Candidatus Apopatosoma intestinale]
MEIILVGACGRMGREVARALPPEMHVAASVDVRGPVARIGDYAGEADVILDFSSHRAAEEVLAYAVRRHLPCVMATTGHTDAERAAIREAAEEIPLFYAENLSLGAAFLARVAVMAARTFPGAEIEIVEAHRAGKRDAPSGTARSLSEKLAAVTGGRVRCGRCGDGGREPGEIAVHALRLGSLVGRHTVIMAAGEELFSFSHEAADRAVFANGAVEAVRFLVGKEAGLYGMEDMIG